MKVLMNTGGIAQTNSFLVVDEAAKQAVIFDAPDHTTGQLIDEARNNGWDVIGLWLTHGHFDHVWDHAVVTRAFPNAKVLFHELEQPKLLRPDVQTRMFGLPSSLGPLKADAYVTDGQELFIGAIRVVVIHTPGHAPGHVVYHMPREKALVGGDLIIGGSIGRTDLPDSRHEQLEASVRKVMTLPPDTRLLPGHGEPVTLGQEMENNAYVRQIVGEAP
jgi:glyoxylase-like metal-dependent hydrolase (beta-lactamase superfamily II)